MLHVVYRSYGGENAKGRPPYYSKLLSLWSLVRAVEEFEGAAEIIYLNDGPIPEDRLAVMRRSGEVIANAGLGNKGSLRATLALPAKRNWPADDLIWLAEDDYLYLPWAIASLSAAADAFPEASYFGLYASCGNRPPEGGCQPDYAPVPDGWSDTEPQLVHGHPWRRALSTTASFGARVGPLLQDRPLFHAALWSGAGWDHTMSLLYQGFEPFPWSLVTRPVQQANSWYRRARGGVIGGIRLGLNALQAVRQRSGREARLLVAPEPALATHVEEAHLALGNDWEAVARDCWRWVEERARQGLMVGLEVTMFAGSSLLA